jgi:hypothetical protein
VCSADRRDSFSATFVSICTGEVFEARKLTLGIAYTRLPKGATVDDSGVDVARKSKIFGPLSWS